MSRRDGTGPTGMGPKTSRGLGLKMGLGTKRRRGNTNNPENKK